MDTQPPSLSKQGYTTVDQLCCSSGHPLRDAFLTLTEKPFRCTYKESAGARECGEIVWVLFGGGPLVYAASLTYPQFLHIQGVARAEGLFGVMRWLGAPVYPVVPRKRAA